MCNDICVFLNELSVLSQRNGLKDLCFRKIPQMKSFEVKTLIFLSQIQAEEMILPVTLTSSSKFTIRYAFKCNSFITIFNCAWEH